MCDTTLEFAAWLEQGGSRVGQVLIRRHADGWELRHEADADSANLATYQGTAAARALANLDDAGAYRPLKTAPNLRRGWVLMARDARELRKAIDTLYPAMIGLWVAQRAGEVEPVHLRETLARQTGMYRVTQKITDPQAQDLVGRVCEPRGGCIKTVLWRLAPDMPITSLPAEKFVAPSRECLPLWCHEACNILVAEARKTVKGERAES
jgi:sirohydrochlorin cobaltochelatase